MTGLADRLLKAWQRFWFVPQQTSTLAVFRIAFGLLATVWTATQGPNILAFYGPHGILPETPNSGTGAWGLLDVSDSSAAVVVVFVLTLTASVALTLGLFTRLAAFLVFAGVVTFEHRNMLVTNSGDGLIRNLAFFTVLTPSGEALSLDRLRKKPENFWEFPARAPWGLRLIQIQLSVGYLSAVWHKAGNSLWREGTAVSYSLRMQDIHHLPTPAFITHSVVLTEILTYGTLASEFALGVLIWNRVARPYVLVIGVALHLSIDLSIMVGFFSYAVLTAYLAFITPETSARRIVTTRDFLRRRFRRREAGEPEEPVAVPVPEKPDPGEALVSGPDELPSLNAQRTEVSA